MIWVERLRAALSQPAIPTALVILMGLHTVLSTLYYDVLILVLPLPGIVFAIVGFLTTKRALAFLLGTAPFLPLLLLGLPKAFITPLMGIPNGLIALGGALLTRQGIQTGIGVLLLFFPFFWMLFLFSRLQG